MMPSLLSSQEARSVMLNWKHLYGFLLIVKGGLNLGASIVACFIMKDFQMGGFLFALFVADTWLGAWSLD